MATLSAFALTTLARVRETLPDLSGTGEEDDRLIQLINDTTSLLESAADRKLKARTYKPTGAGAGEENLILNGDDRISESEYQVPEWPLNTVSAITILPADLDVTSQTVLSSTDWTFIAPGKIKLLGSNVWTLGTNNIEMTWNAGYQAVHNLYPILEKACIDQVRYEWFRMKNPQDLVSSISDPGGSVSYFQGPLLPQVRMLIENTFRRKGLI